MQDVAQRAGLAYSEFQRQAPDGFRRIQMGLKAMRDGVEVGDDGAIIGA